jgi:hypothetical protein
MIGLFKRQPRAAPSDTSQLGHSALAMVVPPGSAQAPGCTAVLIDPAGRARRIEASARVAPAPGETAWLFRPGPYHFDLRPFDAAVELGLRLSFVIDAPDPHAHQQRFDLYLASEAPAGGVLRAADFFAAIEDAVQRELRQGHLELPPCTSLAEWNSFRAGLNRLLYLRFGVTVDECLPVDLGGQVDYAAILAARAASAPPQDSPATPMPTAASEPAPLVAVLPPAPGDAAALRRLFLELPCLMCALRLAVLPRGPALFRRHQELLRRLDLLNLQVATMPALALAAPALPLDGANQQRRAFHSRRACAALDEAWALLARLQLADQSTVQTDVAALDGLFDDAERIVANLECDLHGRRLVRVDADLIEAADEVAP